tara:strand:- start:101 stop:3730 length:3630 start_codon:yes stop_codon:yes gene_type:complete
MSVKTLVKTPPSYNLDNSFQHNFRNPEKKFNFQKILEKCNGRRVRTSDAKLGSYYNIQTFSKNATEGLKAGNNRRGTWLCPENQIRKFITMMEVKTKKGYVPDRTIAWKQPHQTSRDDKTSPLWFDFDIKDTNRILNPDKSPFKNQPVPVKFNLINSGKFDGNISYEELGIYLADVINNLIIKKFPHTQTLFYYIYYDEMKKNNGFWIYFNKNFYIQDKKIITEEFQNWCAKHLEIIGLHSSSSFYKDNAPLKNPFVCPLIPKEDRAFKLIFESNDPDFKKMRSKVWSIYDPDEEDDYKDEVFMYNRKMERKLFHHQNNLEILGNAYPPEIASGNVKPVGKIGKVVNAEFLHRLNRLRNQYPELSDVLAGAEKSVSTSVYQGKGVWNIKIEPNTCVCPIHKTTHHRAVGYVNIYKGSIQNVSNFYCLHSGTHKTYVDKELNHKKGTPKQSKSLKSNLEDRRLKWRNLFADFNFSHAELDIQQFGLLVKQFYPDIKYVEENSLGKDCFYMWDNKSGIWEELADKKQKKINTLIRKWWREYAVPDLTFMAEEIHNEDDPEKSKKFGSFKKKIKQQLSSKTKIDAVLDSFSIESGIATQSRFGLLLNSKRNLLPFQNGTIDWGYTDTRGKYHPPDKPFRCIEKDDYVSLYIKKTYCGKYNKPDKFPFSVGKDIFKTKGEYEAEYEFLWTKLDELFETTLRNADQREYVKDQIAYGQTGYTHFKTFMALIGHLANNGKSSLCGILASQLYPFCVRLNEKLFTDPDLHPTYLDDMRAGIRMGYIEEVKDGKKINAQRVKEWVGLLNEIAKIRVLYKQKQAEFNFFSKFWICSNFDIPLDKKDNGLKDRMRVAEFTTRFLKANEWDRKLEQKKDHPDPVKYWNDRGFYLEDNRFTQIFKESELMASVFQDYFYTRSCKAVQIKDLIEPESMRELRTQICEKIDQIAMFINDSIAQGVMDEDNQNKGDWISKDQFFQYYRRWLSKTQSGLKNWAEQVQVQKFNHYVKSYIAGNEIYPEFQHMRNGGKKVKENGREVVHRNIIYGLKWIHKKIHKDPDGTLRGGWDNKKSYKEREQEKARRRWKAHRDDQDYNSDEDYTDIEDDDSDAPPEPVKIKKKTIAIKKELAKIDVDVDTDDDEPQLKLCIKKKTKLGECCKCGSNLYEGDGKSKYYDKTSEDFYCEKHSTDYFKALKSHKDREDTDTGESEEECFSDDDVE